MTSAISTLRSSRRRSIYEGTVSVVLPAAGHLPDGSPFGTLRLRRSPKCGTEWGSAYYANPQLYTVRITLRRPADGAIVTSAWANNPPPGSYGDMLSTKIGCVLAQAQVITPQATSSPDETSCLR